MFDMVTVCLVDLYEISRLDLSTPIAAVSLTAILGELAEQGIELPGEPETTLADYLEERLGAVPATGQTFTVEGQLGVVGSISGTPAAGFFPVPDELQSVTILVRED